MDLAKVDDDKRCRPVNYVVGDLVLVDHPEVKVGRSHGKAHKFYGLFVVLDREGEVDYKIQCFMKRKSR